MIEFLDVLGKYKQDFVVKSELRLNKYEYSGIRRRRVVLERFFSYIYSNYSVLDSDNIARAFSSFKEYEYAGAGDSKSINSIHEDLQALRHFISQMQQINCLPKAKIPKLAKINQQLLRDKERNDLLGSLNPQDWKKTVHSDSALINSMDAHYVGDKT